MREQGSSRHLLPDTKKELVDMRIDWEECDPDSGVITQVLGRSYRDHEATRTHVRREYERVYGEVRMKAALYIAG